MKKLLAETVAVVLLNICHLHFSTLLRPDISTESGVRKQGKNVAKKMSLTGGCVLFITSKNRFWPAPIPCKFVGTKMIGNPERFKN